ncbi:MAG: hypothetical protein OXG44_15100 [Gammaproteobacteria bacterium]|nr:hypothetical protein [Gammaproteobacteria bacterium]
MTKWYGRSSSVLNDKLSDKDFVLDLMSDESMKELARLTIREALFQPVRTKTSEYSTKEADSPAVHTARRIADQAAKEIVDRMVSHLIDDERFRSLVSEALATALPIAIRGFWHDQISRQQEQAVISMSSMIKENSR